MTDKKKFADKVKELFGVEGWGKIKQAYQEAAAGEEMPMEMMEATLVDGTKITYDKLAEGAKVQVITTEGPMDAPDGEHELTDGTKITVQGGLITAIEAAAAAEEVAEETQMGEEALTKESVQAMIDAAIGNIPKESVEHPTVKEEEMAQEIVQMRQDMGAIVKLMDYFMEEQQTQSENSQQKFGKEAKIEKRKQIASLMAQYRNPVKTK